MPDAHHPDPTRGRTADPPVVHAVLHAGPTATPYAAAGQGPPVLLLDGIPPDADLLAALARLLGGRRRVIQPVPPQVDNGHAVSAWLRTLCEGLGLPAAALVGRGELGVAALGFALLEPDRVERIVLIHDDLPDKAIHASAVEDRLAATGHPLLLVRRTGLDRCPTPVCAAVAKFLGPPAPNGGA